ncbi:uncharacterized protein LOC125595413 [Brassica napus]|nr:uncharacterized protein LOC125595413 [Brassica napus]
MCVAIQRVHGCGGSFLRCVHWHFSSSGWKLVMGPELSSGMMIGRLIDVTGATGTRYLGITHSARVCDAVSQNQWSIRGHRSRHFQELHAKIQTTPVPDPQMEDDKYLWKHDIDDYKDYFSSARTWEQIRCKKEAVNWSNGVWFKQGIPRCTFIVWLAIQNRLSTGD